MRDEVLAYLFIGACLLSIASGIGLMFTMDDVRWLWLCLPIVFFLS